MKRLSLWLGLLIGLGLIFNPAGPAAEADETGRVYVINLSGVDIDIKVNGHALGSLSGSGLRDFPSILTYWRQFSPVEPGQFHGYPDNTLTVTYHGATTRTFNYRGILLDGENPAGSTLYMFIFDRELVISWNGAVLEMDRIISSFDEQLDPDEDADQILDQDHDRAAGREATDADRAVHVFNMTPYTIQVIANSGAAATIDPAGEMSFPCHDFPMTDADRGGAGSFGFSNRVKVSYAGDQAPGAYWYDVIVPLARQADEGDLRLLIFSYSVYFGSQTNLYSNDAHWS